METRLLEEALALYVLESESALETKSAIRSIPHSRLGTHKPIFSASTVILYHHLTLTSLKLS